MKHAEMHIDRILFLEGTPVVSNLRKMMIGANIEAQLRNDHSSELTRICPLNPKAYRGFGQSRSYYQRKLLRWPLA